MKKTSKSKGLRKLRMKLTKYWGRVPDFFRILIYNGIAALINIEVQRIMNIQPSGEFSAEITILLQILLAVLVWLSQEVVKLSKDE